MISKPLHPSCEIVKNKTYTNCLENVSKIIDSNGPYDIISLQEASNWQIIRSITPTLFGMKYVSHKLDLDEIVIFYHSKYELDSSENILKGHMSDLNRPLMALFFSNKLCIINLHAGHYVKSNKPNKKGKYYQKDIYKLDYYFERILGNEPDADIYLDKLLEYDIIITGDFNDELNDGLKFFGRNLYGFNTNPSCCNTGIKASSITCPKGQGCFDSRAVGTSLASERAVPALGGQGNAGIEASSITCLRRDSSAALGGQGGPKLNGQTLKFSFDHILSTYQNNHSQVIPVIFASDHMPVIAHLSKNIGYDFDGVLHTNVSPPDDQLQRHPHSLRGPYDPFNKIILQIKNEILDGHHIYIITARKKTQSNENTIIKHLENNGLKKFINKIKIYFSAGVNKTEIINNIKINAFYDDSCLRILELIQSQVKNLLPYLTQIFLVDPDKKKWYLINEKSIVKMCPINHGTEKSILCYKLINLSSQIGIISSNTKIDKCADLINEYVANYQFKFSNPEIKKLLDKLKNDLGNDKLQIEIIKLIISDIYNHYLAEN